jgi:hypothetical protein
MKQLFRTALLLVAFAFCAAAQTPAPALSADVFKLGDREVSIPPPEGFVEAASRSAPMKKFFETAEPHQLDFLAAYVPAQVMEQITRGERPVLAFYTRVAISKNLRGVVYSQADFSKLVATLHANSAKALDINSPEMRAMLKQQSKDVSALRKEHVGVDLSQPVRLGEIERTASSYGTLELVKATFVHGDTRKERMVLSVACVVRVRERLLLVYTYKLFNSEADADTLRDFTKRWVADILRANAP